MSLFIFNCPALFTIRDLAHPKSWYFYSTFFPLFLCFFFTLSFCGVFVLWTLARGFPCVLFWDLHLLTPGHRLPCRVFCSLVLNHQMAGDPAQQLTLLSARVSSAGIWLSPPQLTSIPDPLSSSSGFMTSQSTCFLISSVQVLTKCGIGAAHCSAPLPLASCYPVRTGPSLPLLGKKVVVGVSAELPGSPSLQGLHMCLVAQQQELSELLWHPKFGENLGITCLGVSHP